MAEWKHNKYKIHAKLDPNNHLFEITRIFYQGKILYENGMPKAKEYNQQKLISSFMGVKKNG